MTELPIPKNRSITAASRHFNFAEGSYLETSRQPLYALVFLLPLIIIYEVGTILVQTDQITHTQARVVAFTWLMAFAKGIGVPYSLAWAFPGIVVVIILLCWHLSSAYPWRIRFGRLGWMALECVILSLPLLVLNATLGSSAGYAAVSTTIHSRLYLANLITSIGAGIYEEMVFRLIGMGLILMIMEDALKIKAVTATIVATAVSATLFAAHHYVGLDGSPGEIFSIVSFIFRTIAGVYFAIIFYYRGFGIIAGTHAAYNMILYSALG